MNVQAIPLVALAALTLAAGCSAENRKARHLRNADSYFQEGRYDQAEIEYRNVLKFDRANPHAIARLGILYFDQGRAVRAYPFLLHAAELSPNDPAVRLRHGFIHMAEGKLAEARADALAVLDLSPTNQEAPLLLAQTARRPAESTQVRQRLDRLEQQIHRSAPVHLARGTLLLHPHQRDLAGAEKEFRNAVQLDPESHAAHAALGTLLWAKNDLAGAETELKAAADLAPKRSPRHLEYSEFLLRTGHADQAKQNLTELTRTVPDYLPPWIKLAQIALQQNQPAEAETLVSQALSRDPGNYEAMLLAGGIKLARGQVDQAIDELERLNAVYRSALGRYNLGLAHLAKGDPAKALKQINEALAINPGLDEAVLVQAQLNLRRGDSATAIAALTQLVQRRPQLPQARLLLGSAHAAKGDLDQALAEYRRLAELQPKTPQPHVLAAAILRAQQKPDLARQACETALDLQPGYLPAIEMLVNFDLEAHPDNARQRLESELAKSPNAPELHLLLGRVLAAKNDVAGAEAAMLKAIELNANFQPAYLMLARLYVSSRQNEKALARLNEAITRNPRDIPALMLLAVTQNEQKQYADARATYEKLLAVQPNYSPALNNLAWLYSEKLGLLEQAYDSARKARDISPYDPFSADTLGWILVKRGEYSWAISLLQESADKLPSEPEVQYHLGIACYHAGDETRAREALTRAASAEKEFPGKADAALRLALLGIDPAAAGPDAVALLETRIREHADDSVARRRLATIYQRQGATDKAVALYEAALQQSPRNPALLIDLALLYSEQLHNTAKALPLAREAYKYAPDDPRVAHVLGRLAFDSGDCRWAVSLLEQAARKSADPALLHDLAWAYYGIGRVDDADLTLRGTLAALPAPLQPGAEQFLDLITAPARPAEVPQAEAEARRLLQKDPVYAPALMVIALAAEQKGDTNAAVRAYEQVLQRFPEFIPAMRGLVLLQVLNPASDRRAYELALKARDARPADPELARAMGILLCRRGEYRESVRLLAGNTRENAPPAVALYYLGMAHHGLKQTADCRNALQRALALSLPEPLAAEARRVLDEMKAK